MRPVREMPDRESAHQSLLTPSYTQTGPGVGPPGPAATHDPGVLNAGAGVTVLPHKKSRLKSISFARPYCPYYILYLRDVSHKYKVFSADCGK